MRSGGSLSLVPLTVGGSLLTSLAELHLGGQTGKPFIPCGISTASKISHQKLGSGGADTVVNTSGLKCVKDSCEQSHVDGFGGEVKRIPEYA